MILLKHMEIVKNLVNFVSQYVRIITEEMENQSKTYQLLKSSIFSYR